MSVYILPAAGDCMSVCILPAAGDCMSVCILPAAGDWAFAAIAAIESQYLIQHGGDHQTLHLSEQQLLSCCNSKTGFPHSNGCQSGNSDDVSKLHVRLQLTDECVGVSLIGLASAVLVTIHIGVCSLQLTAKSICTGSDIINCLFRTWVCPSMCCVYLQGLMYLSMCCVFAGPTVPFHVLCICRA